LVISNKITIKFNYLYGVCVYVSLVVNVTITASVAKQNMIYDSGHIFIRFTS
jgi:hypothetical protein